MIKGIRHIHLKVRDVDRAVRFYTEALGFRVGHTAHDGAMAFLQTPGGDDLLTLSSAELPSEIDGAVRQNCGDSGGVDHFGCSLNDACTFSRVLDAIIEAGGIVLERGEILGAPTAFARDVDGYAFQIYVLPEPPPASMP